MQPGPIKSIDHVGVVVRDLDEALRRSSQLGIGPWSLYTFGSVRTRDMVFRGSEQRSTWRVAIVQLGPIMYELIEPLDGPNPYQEFLDESRAGLHHLGFFVDDIGETISEMQSRGIDLLMSGRGFGVDGDGAYAYFDTEEAMGCIVEALQLPANMPPPESVYPA